MSYLQVSRNFRDFSGSSDVTSCDTLLSVSELHLSEVQLPYNLPVPLPVLR